MHSRNLGILFLLCFTLVSCATLSEPFAPDEAEKKGEGMNAAPAEDKTGEPTRVVETPPDTTGKSEEPKPAESQPAEPELTEPESAEPESAEPEEPREAESDLPAPASTEPETVPETTEPIASLPDYRPDDPLDSLGFLMLSPKIDSGMVAEAVTETEDSSVATGPRQSGAAAETAVDERASDRSSSQSSSAGRESLEAVEAAARSQASRLDSQSPSGGDGAQKSEEAQAEGEPTEPGPAETAAELIRAGKGEQVHLSLPGFGWIYDRGASQAQGVEFLSRSYAQSATEFVFNAQAVGRYTLAFQQQNSSIGRSTLRRIGLEVSPDSIQDKITAAAAGAEKAAEGGGDSQAAGGRVGSEGEQSRPPSQMQLPEFSFERLENALGVRNANSTAQQVQALLIRRTREPLSGVDIPGREQLQMMVDAGQLLFEAGREALAEQVLKLYLKQGEELPEMDHSGRALFLLGQIYESPLPPRDERRSVEYYRRIVSFFPTDPYRRRAEERIKYLQRHFLQIR